MIKSYDIWQICRATFIKRERTRTVNGEPIAYPIPERPLLARGVPTIEQESSILRILQEGGLIRITQKTVPYTDPLGLDPYENVQTIRAVEVLDIGALQKYRTRLTILTRGAGSGFWTSS